MLILFQGMDQQQIMTRLASQIDEWGQLYPGLNKLAAIGLTIPISSVNCERDFSTLNRLIHQIIIIINNDLVIA